MNEKATTRLINTITAYNIVKIIVKIIALCAAVALVLVMIFGSPENALERRQEKFVQVDMSDGGQVEVIYDEDDSSFSDGQSFVRTVFPDDGFRDRISQNSNWKPLPAGEMFDALLWGISTAAADGEEAQIGPYITDGDRNPLIPNIKNGYYLFKNRSDQEKIGEFPDLERVYSLNFTFAVYDCDTRTLYYCEFDT